MNDDYVNINTYSPIDLGKKCVNGNTVCKFEIIFFYFDCTLLHNYIFYCYCHHVNSGWRE